MQCHSAPWQSAGLRLVVLGVLDQDQREIAATANATDERMATTSEARQVTGKTQLLKSILKDHPQYKRVLMVTYRITLSYEFEKCHAHCKKDNRL